MADVSEVIKHSVDIVNYKAKIFTATVSTDDTITFSSFSSVSAFYSVQQSDGTTEVAGSISSNVVTITTAGLTNVKIVGLVVGVPS